MPGAPLPKLSDSAGAIPIPLPPMAFRAKRPRASRCRVLVNSTPLLSRVTVAAEVAAEFRHAS